MTYHLVGLSVSMFFLGLVCGLVALAPDEAAASIFTVTAVSFAHVSLVVMWFIKINRRVRELMERRA